MPLTKQAKKKLRKDRKREKLNLILKKEYKKSLKNTRSNPSKKNLTETNKVLDKSAKKGIMHKNKAARLKSRLARNSSNTKQNTSKKSVSK